MDAWTRKLQAGKKRLALKAAAVSHLGGQCEICGYSKSIAAMDFHHEDSRTKDFDISSKSSWAKILPELAKCVLLCSNCHREVHAGLHPQYLMLDDRYDSDTDDEP